MYLYLFFTLDLLKDLLLLTYYFGLIFYFGHMGRIIFLLTISLTKYLGTRCLQIIAEIWRKRGKQKHL